MFKSYTDVRDWLENFIPQVWGKEELGLARIEYLLKLLGNPEKKFKSIHVAGTSGKGSTAYYVAKLLQLSVLGFQLSDEGQSVSQLTGQETDKLKTDKLQSVFRQKTRPNRKQKTDNWKVGLHISPHLVDIRERMQIFESSKSKSKVESLMPIGTFIRLFNEIKPVVEKIKKEKPDLTPSYFEILVAATFKYFADEKVDWAVVEVGLGGRLDATNVLQPLITLITNVGLDHTEILGKTVEKIAFEKAGIIKRGVSVVTGASSKALEVIAKVARERQAPLIIIDTQDGMDANKFLALAAVEAVGVKVDGRAVETAFEAKFAGRLEEIAPGVILDGAHNPDKVRFLIDFIVNSKLETRNSKQIKKYKNPKFEITLVLAFKKGKNWKKMVDLLVKNLPVKKVFATKFYATTDTGRFAAVEPKEILDYVNGKWKMVNGKSIEDSQEAVFEAINLAYYTPGVKETYTPGVSDTLVLVTGSLYLVGEVRTMWKLPFDFAQDL